MTSILVMALLCPTGLWSELHCARYSYEHYDMQERYEGLAYLCDRLSELNGDNMAICGPRCDLEAFKLAIKTKHMLLKNLIEKELSAGVSQNNDAGPNTR